MLVSRKRGYELNDFRDVIRRYVPNNVIAMHFREQVAEASYEVALDSAPHHTPPEVSMTVPPGQFFVMGDYRFDARDSRYFGSISFASIAGKKL
jgi:hypothetical protein